MSANTLYAAHADGHEHHESNSVFGFWIYLMTDCILFATIFATFAVLSHSYAGGPTRITSYNVCYTKLLRYPCIAISSLVLGFNLLADGLREVSLRD